MKLLTYTVGKVSRIGALSGNCAIDLNSAYAEYLKGVKGEKAAKRLADERLPPNMIQFLDGGNNALAAAKSALDYVKKMEKAGKMAALKKAKIVCDTASVHIEAPIPRPRKNLFCLGLNYAKHAAEGGQPVPKDPVFFTKPPTVVIGPYDDIVYPKATEKLDYEVEFAFIIGKRGKYIPKEKALDHVAGYTVFNDVSARDLQFKHLQWFKGKGCDTFGPMGPYLVTKDEVPDPHNLSIRCRVNGEVRQDSNTNDLIFKIPQIVEVLSAGMTLEPGDIIATGTPSGVGQGFKPPRLLSVGDVVECEIERLGCMRNRVRAE